MSLIILMIPIVGTITGIILWLDISLNRYRSKFLEFSSKTEDKSKIRERLEELGNQRADAYGEFRFNQLLISISVALIPIVAAALLIINLATALGLSIFLGILNFLLYDHYLDSKVKRHREIIEAEFPAILEMLTLAIAAGEPPISAFSRVSERSSSLLSGEFRKVVLLVRKGIPFHEALDQMGRSLKSNTIRRFIDALVMAMVRGAPIVEVFHRHVAEARLNQRNLVMDKAGKAETTMMIPIVFLILPISVLFALWPSINQLSFFTS